MILRAGHPVFPQELEETLRGHPDVEEVAVVTSSDGGYAPTLKACVVLKSGGQATTEHLMQFCIERLAAYKCPDMIRFYKDLPRLEDGTLDVEELSR